VDLSAIVSALPWLRRGWKLVPPAMRVPVLIVAAGVGIWYAVNGRQQLAARDRVVGP